MRPGKERSRRMDLQAVERNSATASNLDWQSTRVKKGGKGPGEPRRRARGNRSLLFCLGREGWRNLGYRSTSARLSAKGNVR